MRFEILLVSINDELFQNIDASIKFQTLCSSLELMLIEGVKRFFLLFYLLQAFQRTYP